MYLSGFKYIWKPLEVGRRACDTAEAWKFGILVHGSKVDRAESVWPARALTKWTQV